MPRNIDILKIQLTASAYFYKVKDGETVDAIMWSRICKSIRDSINLDKDYFEESGWRLDGNTHYGICAFKYPEKKAAFAAEMGDFWKERKTGYFMIIVHDGYVAILKKNINIPTCVSKVLLIVDYNSITKLHNDATYTKISLRNIEGNEQSLQTKSYEANDLKVSMPYVGASHYSIRSLRGKPSNGKVFGITPSTARVGEASTFNRRECLDWVRQIIQGLQTANATNEFLSLFAESVDYSTVQQGLTPSSVLLYVGLINDLLDDQATTLSYISNGHPINKEHFSRYVNIMAEKVWLLQPTPDATKFSATKHKFIVSKNVSGIHVHCDSWRDINIDSTNYSGTLDELINQESLFNVYFQQVDYVFTNNTLFCNHHLINGWQRLMPTLKTNILFLNTTKSEKVRNKTLAGIRNWDNDSIFHCVETHLNQDNEVQYVICDDCGDEWADHIGICQDKVSFYVEKHKPFKRTCKSSASAFQDVVSQALKNLGNFTPLKSSWTTKKAKWQNIIPPTRIQSLRKHPQGKLVDDAIQLWKKNINSPHFQKEMCIVVNFLSIREFENSLKNINNPRMSETRRSTTYQRLWILSSFVNTCLEVGVKPIVCCAP